MWRILPLLITAISLMSFQRNAGIDGEQVCTPLATVRIQLFGDSTQVGYDGTTLQPLRIGPSELLQAAMDRRFGAGKVIVTHRAVGGTTANQLLAGSDSLNKPWPQSVDADMVVVNHGINDMRLGVPINDYKSALIALGATVYETPIPTVASVSWNHPGYATAMREAVGMDRIADVDAYVRSLPNWQGFLADRVHPNIELYRLIAENVVAPTLVPIIERLQCSRSHHVNVM